MESEPLLGSLRLVQPSAGLRWESTFAGRGPLPTVLEREAGETLVRLDGQVITTTVVFGEADAPSLLGVVTLETALLAVDPVRQRLIPTEALLMVGLGAGSPAVAPIPPNPNSSSS